MFGRRLLVAGGRADGPHRTRGEPGAAPSRCRATGRATGPTPTPQAAEPQRTAARGPSRRRSTRARATADDRGPQRRHDRARRRGRARSDTVVIDELAGSEPVEPDSPAHFEIYADTPGTTRSLLLETGRRIGAAARSRARADVGRRARLGVVARDEASAAVAPRAGDRSRRRRRGWRSRGRCRGRRCSAAGSWGSSGASGHGPEASPCRAERPTWPRADRRRRAASGRRSGRRAARGAASAGPRGRSAGAGARSGGRRSRPSPDRRRGRAGPGRRGRRAASARRSRRRPPGAKAAAIAPRRAAW